MATNSKNKLITFELHAKNNLFSRPCLLGPTKCNSEIYTMIKKILYILRQYSESIIFICLRNNQVFQCLLIL